MELTHRPSHPLGDSQFEPEALQGLAEGQSLAVETFGGRIHVEWDPQAAVTPLGQLAFFIEFLKLGNLFEPWVAECPLERLSPNSPHTRDVLGTLLLSILAGHQRYAHITALRGDHVNPQLLGMRKLISEDSMRRALIRIEEEKGVAWLQSHLSQSYQPLLCVPWILDVDVTVKPLYGHQEGAVVGYNPKKPGRPSHTYHSYFIGNLRLILDVEVQAGNEMASSYSAPNLWRLLDAMPVADWPRFIRGDCAFGTDGVMSEAEKRGLPYLFKLKATKNVQRLIERLMTQKGGVWEPAGQGWEGQSSELQLHGWSIKRRVVVLRKQIPKEFAVVHVDSESQQLEMYFGETNQKTYVYEYAVLVTSLPDEVITIAQHYRDRADSENVFDELKNQWGWSGFTTQDLKRCRLIARMIALIYNWWNLFVRLAEPQHHLEAITSRPLLLHAVGKQTTHAGQTRLTISSSHGKLKRVQSLLNRITTFFKTLKALAEQLTPLERWYAILSRAVEPYLQGRSLQPPHPPPIPV